MRLGRAKDSVAIRIAPYRLHDGAKSNLKPKLNMSTEWLIPIGCIVIAVLTPEPTLKWVFGLLGVLILGFFLGHSNKDK